MAQHDNIRQIVMPTPTSPYYVVNGRGETFYYEIGSLAILSHETRNQEGFFGTVLQLHRNFLLGREGLFNIEGTTYVAWVGLIALAISLMGFYLWWRVRNQFRTKNILPNGVRRTHFYYSHMTGGVVTLIAVLMLAITGASIVYRDIAKQVLGVVDNHEAITQQKALTNTWQAWLTEANQAMPNSELTSIRFPRPLRNRPNNDVVKVNSTPTNTNKHQANNVRQPGQVKKMPAIYELRYLNEADWFGLANSKVKIDKTSSTLVDAIPFGNLLMGEKIYSILVPLHTGRNLHSGYVIVLLIFSFIGLAMVFSGVASFVMKERQWKKVLPISQLKPQR